MYVNLRFEKASPNLLHARPRRPGKRLGYVLAKGRTTTLLVVRTFYYEAGELYYG